MTEAIKAPRLAPNAEELLRALKRRWLVALLGSLIAGGAAAAGVWAFLPISNLTARALLHVEASPPAVVFAKGESRADFQSYQRTQVALVKSRLVLNAALRNPDVANIAVIRDSVDPVAWLQKELQVDFSVAPEILRIALSGSHAEELEVIVDRVAKAYLDEIVNKEDNKKRERLDKLKEIYDRYEDSLRRKRRTVRELSESVGTGDPHTLALKQRFAQEQLAWTEKELLQLESDLRKLKIEDSTNQEKKKSINDESIPDSYLKEQIQKDTLIVKYQTRKLELEQAILSTQKVAVTSVSDSLVEKYRNEIAHTEQLIENRMAQLRPVITTELRERGRREVRSSEANVRQRIQLLEELKKSLAKEASRLTEETRTLNKGSLDIESYKYEIANAEETVKKIASELEVLSVELRAPPRVTELEKAYVALPDDRKKRALATLATCCLVMGGVSFFVARNEARTRYVGSADDVDQALGIPLLGTLPLRAPEYQGQRLMTPESPDKGTAAYADSLNLIRNYLMHVCETQAVKTLMITSAVNGEGKTSLACNVAASFARFGRKTLLIDCDCWNPAAHRVLDATPGGGMIDLLQNTAETIDVVQSTSIHKLWLIPAGGNGGIPAEALTGNRFRTILDSLSDQFDIIIIDSSPVLLVTDTLLLGKKVDGVILSVFQNKSRIPCASAAYERLRKLGVNVLGSVVHGVPCALQETEYLYQSSSPANDRSLKTGEA